MGGVSGWSEGEGGGVGVKRCRAFDACWGSLSWAVHGAASRPKALYKFNASDNLQLAPILDMTH